jgi:hypothetical protein
MQVTDLFWTTGMVHLFLDLFSNGWFVLAFLGLAYVGLERRLARRPAPSRIATPLLLVGLPLTFLLGMPVSIVPAHWRLLAGLGGALTAAGLGLHLWALRDLYHLVHWRVPYVMMALNAVLLLAVSQPGLAAWGEQMGLRILYLHILLLGALSLGLLAAVFDTLGERAVRGWRWMSAAVLLLLVSLLPISGLWPAAWRGVWALHFAAWAALAPVLVVAGMLTAAFAVHSKTNIDSPWEVECRY